MSEFKVNDKVYFPCYGTGIFKVEANSYNENLDKYPLMIGARTFTVHGKNYENRLLQDIFHATPENHELLEKLYGVEFEKPPVQPTSKEIIQAMLARGDKCVCCWVSDFEQSPTADNTWDYITDYMDDSYPFTISSGSGWKYATPFDIRTGLAITEMPE